MHRLALIIAILFSVNINNVYSRDDYTDNRTYHSVIDSLENMLNDKSLDDEELLSVYYGLSFAYSEDNQDKFAHYSLLAMRLAQDIRDYVTESVVTRNYIAYLSYNGMNDSVAGYYERALELLEEIEGTDNEELIDRETSLLAGTMGNHYNMIGENLKAIDEYQKALRVFEKYDQKESMVILYSNMMTIYMSMENYKQAETVMHKALNITEQMNDSLMMMIVNHDLCKLEIKRENYEKAKIHADFCYAYLGVHPEEGLEFSSMLCSMSEIHRLGYGDYEVAERYALQALEVAERYNSIPHLCNAYLELGNIYIHQEEWRKAEAMLLKTLSLDDNDPNGEISCYRNLTRIYIHLDEHEKAIESFDRANELQSRFNEDRYLSSLGEMEVRYETETKELRIAALENEKRFKLWITISIIFIILSVAAWLLSMWRRAEEKYRVAKQKKQLELVEARMKGESDERIRLSHDLHDGLGGMLTGVKLKMELMDQNKNVKESYQNNYDDSMRILRESMAELRRISHHLMPMSLRTNGIKVSLSDYCKSFDNVTFDFYGEDKRLDQQFEILIYRIVHELVNNAVKHSQAESINVQIMQESEYLAILVSDNGCGFELDDEPKGMGLNNIRERVAARNGRLEIISEKGKGTEINIEFELNTTVNYDK